MVRLRFQREGKPGQPHYRLVAAAQRSRRDGRPLEILGAYNPRLPKDKLTVNEERVKYWHKQGAQPSETVKNLLVSMGVWSRINAKA
jgi:small subunit ribosomal protein S16